MAVYSDKNSGVVASSDTMASYSMFRLGKDLRCL